MMKMNISTHTAMLVVLLVGLLFLNGCSFLNDYQDSGELNLAGLKASVKVVRDEKGMAYIYAQDMDDALMAQGFVTAQDRLFQMQLTKLFTQGRLCELAGEKAKSLDIRMRTIGFHRNAKKWATVLNPKTKHFLQQYLDGINTYIDNHEDEYPIKFKLAGIKPEKWTITDSLTLAFYMSWSNAANLKTEIIAQMLVDRVGIEKASTIFPHNINPDDTNEISQNEYAWNTNPQPIGIVSDPNILSYMTDSSFKIGSNNWAVSSRHSPGDKPIVADDPHMDARILPGLWYPCGLITPDFRIVGVGFPGFAGMLLFRNDYIATGVTNAYGDAQDLYVETLDPDNPNHYLEGDTSFSFQVIEEILRIKDKDVENGFRTESFKIRLTKRGPVISAVLPQLKTEKVISLRWAPFETMQDNFGYDKMMISKSVREYREALSEFNFGMLNFVFADKDGDIGWHASGKLPVRSQKDGTVPYVINDSRDNWIGWIPFEEMPHSYNPQKGWVGTCNHYTPKKDSPYYYSSHASASYRYRRLKQLLESPGEKSVHDHWQYQRDTLNLMAKVIAPIMAKTLSRHGDTAELGQMLSQWNFHDDPDRVAPTIFQAVYRNFALLTYQDELGPDLARTMLDNWYFWQERLQKMVLENDSPWFDDVTTKDVKETRDVLFYRAAKQTFDELKAELGDSLQKWQWGKIHTIEFLSPIRRDGFGKGLVGGGEHPVGGSAETLMRYYYAFNEPFKVTVFASLRMVADLNDDEKVLAVLPGGVCGRLFHPHKKDQIESFLNGAKVHWWFSDEAIQKHTQSTLLLNPS